MPSAPIGGMGLASNSRVVSSPREKVTREEGLSGSSMASMADTPQTLRPHEKVNASPSKPAFAGLTALLGRDSGGQGAKDAEPKLQQRFFKTAGTALCDVGFLFGVRQVQSYFTYHTVLHP